MSLNCSVSLVQIFISSISFICDFHNHSRNILRIFSLQNTFIVKYLSVVSLLGATPAVPKLLHTTLAAKSTYDTIMHLCTSYQDSHDSTLAYLVVEKSATGMLKTREQPVVNNQNPFSVCRMGGIHTIRCCMHM